MTVARQSSPLEPPRGPVYDLATHKVRVQLGDVVHGDRVMHGHYPSESNFYWRQLVYQSVLEHKGKFPDSHNRKALSPAEKRLIRQQLGVVRAAYRVEVAGIRVEGELGEGVYNQCYYGAGGNGYGGAQVRVRLLFRAVQANEHRPGHFNHVAYSPRMEWPQSVVLAALSPRATPQEKFEAWWSAPEGFALRCERAGEETGSASVQALRKWLWTAWQLGAGVPVE